MMENIKEENWYVKPTSGIQWIGLMQKNICVVWESRNNDLMIQSEKGNFTYLKKADAEKLSFLLFNALFPTETRKIRYAVRNALESNNNKWIDLLRNKGLTKETKMAVIVMNREEILKAELRKPNQRSKN